MSPSEGLKTWLLSWLSARPALMRELLLRIRKPALQLGSDTVLLGHHEIMQVLQRPSDFTLAPLLRPRILSGDFLLSQDDSLQYRNDKARMQEAFFSEDFNLIDRIRTFSSRCSQQILQSRASGESGFELDFVGELAEPVAAMVLYQLVIGYPESPSQEFVQALRNLGKLIVAGDYHQETRRQEYDDAISVLMQALDTRLTDNTQAWRKDSVVSRMLQNGCSHADIKRDIGGIAAAGVATIARAGGQAFNELLHRPAALLLAREAAASDNEAAMIQCTLEALRFNPMFQFIVRRCEFDTRIECLDGSHVVLRKGKNVSLGLLAAMFDARVFPEPQRFMVTRPRQHYLHFGDGMHRCFGERIAHVQIAQITMALLLHAKTITRSQQQGRGYLEFEGPALRHLMVHCS